MSKTIMEVSVEEWKQIQSQRENEKLKEKNAVLEKQVLDLQSIIKRFKIQIEKLEEKNASGDEALQKWVIRYHKLLEKYQADPDEEHAKELEGYARLNFCMENVDGMLGSHFKPEIEGVDWSLPYFDMDYETDFLPPSPFDKEEHKDNPEYLESISKERGGTACGWIQQLIQENNELKDEIAKLNGTQTD